MSEDLVSPDSSANSVRIIARDESEEERRSREKVENAQKLSERCRALALGIVAVVWGILIGETKVAHSIEHFTKLLLIDAAGLGIFGLFADYLEYLCGYWDNHSKTTSAFKFGRTTMFALKQLATATSVVFLFIGVAMILRPANVAAAGPAIPNSIWNGQVWSDSSPDVKTAVTLYIKSVDAFDRSVSAEEGKRPCQGELLDVNEGSGPVSKLLLRCGNSTLNGVIVVRSGNMTYCGTYMSVISQGHFCFRFGRNNEH